MQERRKMPPLHPGEILWEEFLKPMGLTASDLARGLKLPEKLIDEILSRKGRITGDVALRLAKYFGNSAHFWLGLQMDFDLDVAEDEFGEKIDQEVEQYQS